MTKKTPGRIAYNAQSRTNQINHADKITAAKWVENIDHLVTARDCGKDYAEMRSMWMNMGAFRAFEWLDKNGWEVRKK